MTGASSPDLFADAAVPENSRPGKAHHRPTSETRADVRARVAAGQSTADIAAAYRVSSPTLRAHYRDELGRHHHVPGPEKRAAITELAAAGRTVGEIAAAAGLSRAVLFRCYRVEITPALRGSAEP